MSAGESATPRRRNASWASTPGTRASMQSNRGRDTSPELAVRRRLHALGLRYRVSIRPIGNVRRTADIVFTRAKIAVFIDGCFWHGCPEHYQPPARNAEFWVAKRLRNQERDIDTDHLLLASGWTPMRFWEHEVHDDPEAIVAAVLSAVTRARTVHAPANSPSKVDGHPERPEPIQALE